MVADLPLEVGRNSGCDIVVRDEGVADRALLIHRCGGALMWTGLAGEQGEAVPLPYDRPLAVGGHSLVRVRGEARGKDGIEGAESHTDMLAVPEPQSRDLVLLVGHGPDARRMGLADRPVRVGAAATNDIVLSDRSVSRWHCRVEPLADGVLVRDLGSRNGTWVDGVRVTRAHLRVGSHVRVGRTDLTVARARGGGAPSTSAMVFASASMAQVDADVTRLAQIPWPLLVTGPSGAGKEGVAKALHARGPRAAGPFVAVNAGGISPTLIESELFGHEKGAFTGAAGAHRGVFEQAHNGVLFLDEVAELPLAMQARLLRVLENWEVRRVGSETGITVDVRLVCATHRDLRRMVRDGLFREDLYYRLARLRLAVPALSERADDIPVLAAHFAALCADEVGAKELSDAAVSRLLAYPWPGNVRELRNVVSAACARSASAMVSAEDVTHALGELGQGALLMDGADLDAVIERCGGNLSEAARTLGIARSTLRDRVRAQAKGGAF